MIYHNHLIELPISESFQNTNEFRIKSKLTID